MRHAAGLRKRSAVIAQVHRQHIGALQCGKLKVKNLITNVVKPEDAPQVYRELDKGNPDYLGVVFDWTGEQA